MKKKTVCIFWTERLNPLRGGIHRVILLLLKHLPERGFNVHYLYTLDDYASFTIYNEDSSKEKTIDVNFLKSYLEELNCEIILGQDAVFSSKLTQIVKAMSLQDVKLINEYHCSLTYIPSKLSKEYLRFEFITNSSLKVKLSVIVKYLFYPIWKWQIWKKLSKLYRYNLLNSDITLLLTAREEPIVQSILPQTKTVRCVTIPNPLSWETVENESILLQKKKEILVVSRIYNPEKRIDLVLKIWRELQKRKLTEDWKLRIVGDGVHRPTLMKMAEDMKLKGIIWEGWSDPKTFYNTSSIFMMTSACEGWGLTLTESMQTGVVPLAFDTYPALHDIITDNYDGFIIKNNDIKQYADRMQRLMQNDSFREQIAKNGLVSCQRFATESVMNMWSQLLHTV